MILENGDRRVRYCTGLRGPTGAGDAEGGGKLVRPRGFTPTVLYIIVPVRRGERGGGLTCLRLRWGGLDSRVGLRYSAYGGWVGETTVHFHFFALSRRMRRASAIP